MSNTHLKIQIEKLNNKVKQLNKEIEKWGTEVSGDFIRLRTQCANVISLLTEATEETRFFGRLAITWQGLPMVYQSAFISAYLAPMALIKNSIPSLDFKIMAFFNVLLIGSFLWTINDYNSFRQKASREMSIGIEGVINSINEFFETFKERDALSSLAVSRDSLFAYKPEVDSVKETEQMQNDQMHIIS